jgi:hypothetical protein
MLNKSEGIMVNNLDYYKGKFPKKFAAPMV